MPEEKIKITPAKGRPMLHWVGKKPLDYVKGFPTQLRGCPKTRIMAVRGHSN